MAAPSVAVAPPASSDRLYRPDDLGGADVRLFPVRVEIRQDAGRTVILVRPEILDLQVGDGVEWDFRYFDGADLFIDRVEIDFERPSPFRKSSFKSRKPSVARPHRILSGASKASSEGKEFVYTIHCSSALLVREASATARIAVISKNGEPS